jgi:carboxyl-terminal processing protease
MANGLNKEPQLGGQLKTPVDWQTTGRAILVVMCLLMAASLAIYRNALEPPAVRSAFVLHRLPGSPDRPYRLTAFALQMVKDKYVDPTRVKPRKMLALAVEQVQKDVAEVMVSTGEKENELVVKVDIYQRKFDLATIDSVATMYTALKEILGFISHHLRERSKLKELEYTAINGILSTLDPHSLLLSPEVFRNLKMGTRGSFGGLGIVISQRDGVLTVVSPIDDTPAFKAGLKAGDQIVKIGNESTINMTLNEAVNALRGDPGTRVVLWIAREGWAEPRRFVIVRAIIKIKSVTSRMLKRSIGFIRIKHFSRSTHKEVEKHLKKLKRRGARAVILDLYNNPGGLLEQAIRVADLFLDKGDIVTTVGYAGKKKETMKASSVTTVWRGPVAVLVNSGSASASEILAGALKGRGRAVVLGTRTFGKGSVQVLFENDDGSALKLTIAQYLTPGETSIQSVGIVPDIRFVPVRADKERVNLFAVHDEQREQDLEQHLGRQWGLGKQKPPVAEVRYLTRPRPRQSHSTGLASGNAVDPVVAEMAAELISRNPGQQRKGLLGRIKPFVADLREQQQKRIVRALSKLGVNWEVEPASAVPMLEAVWSLAPEDRAQAGATVKMNIKITNMGLGPAFRVRAVTRADAEPFDRKEFLFGRIDPGQTRSWQVPVHLPQHYRTQLVPVTIKFTEEYGHQPPPMDAVIRVQGARRPVFALQYQLIDDLVGNRDGLPQKGEQVRLRVTVRNLGPGKVLDGMLMLKNLSGSAVFIRKGRVSFGTLEPNSEKVVDFTFDIRKMLASRTLVFEVAAQDSKLRVGVKDRAVFSLSIDGQRVTQQSGWVVTKKEKSELRGGPSPKAPLIGWAQKGARFRLTGKVRGWYRIEWTPGRPAFVAIEETEKLRTQKGRAPQPKVKRHFQVTPPVIRMAKTPLLTTRAVIDLKGVAIDDVKLRDVYVEVLHRNGVFSRKKVFYQSNRFGVTPRTLSFSAQVPLKKGLNYIKVVARDSQRVVSERVRVCLRQKSSLTGLGLASPLPRVRTDGAAMKDDWPDARHARAP